LTELFVPGRLCLFGEHSDWAGAQRIFNADIIPGKAIVTGIEQGIYATVEKSDVFAINTSIDGAENQNIECEMNEKKLKLIAREGGFFSYVAGVASYMLEHYHVGGVQVTITNRTLPIKRGLSSSAAICVLVARAFNKVYGLHLSIKGEMQAAYFGEQRTPSRCGRLDQACAFGVTPVHMTFDGSDIEAEEIHIKSSLHLVFADLMAQKNTIKILSDLNKCYPYPQTDLDKQIHKALGQQNQRIISEARACIENGNIKSLGALMTEAQQIFDEMVAPACPSELEAPVLHSVLNDKTVKQLTYGAKGVGSQGDGTVQFLAKDKECQIKLIDYLENVLKKETYTCTIQPSNRVSKAIVPVAGYGTRLYPATKAIKKEFFPIMDNDGLTKPMILLLLEELDQAGIEKICLVINDDEDKALYDKIFKKSLSESHLEKLPQKMRNYEHTILRLGQKIEYIVQEERAGFGHAVFQCKEFANGDPVLLALGDTFYSTNNERSCTEQLLDAFEHTNSKTVLSIHPVALNEVVHYGMMSGNWQDKNEILMNVNEFVEKPSTDYAQQYLSVDTKKNKRNYFSVFGQYILTANVFDILENMIIDNVAKNAEIQLTGALSKLIDADGLFGYCVDGEMFDIGIPSAFKNTMLNYCKKL